MTGTKPAEPTIAPTARRNLSIRGIADVKSKLGGRAVILRPGQRLAEILVYASPTQGGDLNSDSFNYASMRSGNNVDENPGGGPASGTQAGQAYLGSSYNGWQAFYVFDTSTIPAGVQVADVEFQIAVAGYSWGAAEPFDFELREWETGPDLSVGDWIEGLSVSSQQLCATYRGGIGPGGINVFTSDPAFVGVVNLIGRTNLFMTTSRFTTGLEPMYGIDEYAYWYGASAGTDAPRLRITYIEQVPIGLQGTAAGVSNLQATASAVVTDKFLVGNSDGASAVTAVADVFSGAVGSSAGSSFVEAIAEFVPGDVFVWDISGNTAGASIVSGTATSEGLVPFRLNLNRLVGGAVIQMYDDLAATWIDIDCMILSAKAGWGAGRPQGVLTKADGGSLELELYDPVRLLDPSNPGSPLYPLLQVYRLIRFGYKDALMPSPQWIFMGRMDSIEHTLTAKSGRIRANDLVSLMLNLDEGLFPLYPQFPIRWYDIAVGLLQWSYLDGLVTVIPPAPDIYTAIEAIKPQGEFNQVWNTIAEGALDSLRFAYVRPPNLASSEPDLFRLEVAFAGQSSGEYFIGVNGPLPLEMVSQLDAAGTINVVKVKDEQTQEVSEWTGGSYSPAAPAHRLDRSERGIPGNRPDQPSAAVWANTVLSDLAVPKLQVLPLRIWPENSAQLIQLVTMPALAVVHMTFTSVSPPVHLVGRLYGWNIQVDTDGWAVEMVTWLDS